MNNRITATALILGGVAATIIGGHAMAPAERQLQDAYANDHDAPTGAGSERLAHAHGLRTASLALFGAGATTALLGTVALTARGRSHAVALIASLAAGAASIGANERLRHHHAALPVDRSHAPADMHAPDEVLQPTPSPPRPGSAVV